MHRRAKTVKFSSKVLYCLLTVKEDNIHFENDTQNDLF